MAKHRISGANSSWRGSCPQSHQLNGKLYSVLGITETDVLPLRYYALSSSVNVLCAYPRLMCTCFTFQGGKQPVNVAYPTEALASRAALKQRRNEYPWQASLTFHGYQNPFCGATVISNQHVLTAARCCQMLSNLKAIRVVSARAQY